MLSCMDDAIIANLIVARSKPGARRIHNEECTADRRIHLESTAQVGGAIVSSLLSRASHVTW